MSALLKQLVDQALQLRNQGRNEEAVGAWKSAIAMSPSDPILYYNLAAALGDLGRHEETIKALKQGFANGLKAPEGALVHARALSGLLQTGEATAAYKKYLIARPTDATVHSEYAQLIWMRTGDKDAALKFLNEAIAKAPTVVELQFLRAQLHGQTGDPQTEYGLLIEALTKFGPHPLLEHGACKAALECKNAADAVRHGENLVKQAPAFEQGRSAYCTALVAHGDLKNAQALLDGLRQAAPQNQYYIALQGTIWRLQDDPRYKALFDYDSFVLRAQLETPNGWNSIESYLDDLTSALDDRHQFKSHPFFLSVRSGSQIPSITGADDPAMRAYGEAVAPATRAYVTKLGAADDPLRIRNKGAAQLLSAWSVLLPPNGYHVNHVHPEGWISSACHLRHDDSSEQDNNAGWLKFGEPGIMTPSPQEAEHFINRNGALRFYSHLISGTEPSALKTARRG